MTDRDREFVKTLLRRQEALVRFGADAVREPDLDVLLRRACEVVAEQERVDLSKVLERLPDTDRLLMRAGVGWRPGVVGRVTIPGGAQSAPGYAILTGKPLIANDMVLEERFELSVLLREHGVVSVVNVPIPTARGVFGVLEVDSREPRDFDREDIRFLQTFANLIGAAVDRIRSAETLKLAADENERLLKELQHRVRNNLQIIASLIGLQIERAESEEAKSALTSIRTRLDALRLVHSRLHPGGLVDTTDLRAYLGDLATNLLSFFGEQAASVRLETDLAPVLAKADVAGPLGLIVNEFMTNSLKHGFRDKPGTIGLKLDLDETRAIRLRMCDSGPGLPDPRAPAKGKGMGLEMIHGLADQIGATVEWRNDGGACLTLRLPPRGPSRAGAEPGPPG